MAVDCKLNEATALNEPDLLIVQINNQTLHLKNGTYNFFAEFFT